MTKVVPRRLLNEDLPVGYLESDADYIRNNEYAVIEWLDSQCNNAVKDSPRVTKETEEGMTLGERFESFEDEYMKFDRVREKLSKRRDLHALLLIERLFPNLSLSILAAEHDQIWLDVDDLDATSFTDGQIEELVRCGVFYDGGSLAMWV